MGDEVFDVELLNRLNEEYKVEEKTQVANPPRYDPDSRQKRAQEAARNLDSLIGLKGQRILEIGCGLGDLALELATNYDAEVVGVDVRPQESWKEMSHPRLTLKEHDLTTTDKGAFPDDSFTRIMSQAVWEHIRHPYTALAECQRILHPAGKKYLFANLHRSAIASHLYRLIHFPWPHLLFSPETIASGSFWQVKKIDWAFWVNKLTYAQYLLYFKKLGFFVTHERLLKREIDEAFYQRFEKRLGLYPRFDLELDFFEVILEFDRESPKTPIPDPVYRIGPKHPPNGG